MPKKRKASAKSRPEAPNPAPQYWSELGRLYTHSQTSINRYNPYPQLLAAHESWNVVPTLMGIKKAVFSYVASILGAK